MTMQAPLLRWIAPSLLGASLLLVALPAVAQEGDAAAAGDAEIDPAVAFEGKFTYAGGKKQKEALEAAIERDTEDMNFITRPIARSRLKDKNTVHQAITISLKGDNISVQRDSIAAIVSPASGAAGKWTSPDGESFSVTQKRDGRKITQSFTAEDGSKTIVLTLSKDGKSLTMHVTTRSPKLPKPVVYSLSYRKAG